MSIDLRAVVRKREAWPLEKTKASFGCSDSLRLSPGEPVKPGHSPDIEWDAR